MTSGVNHSEDGFSILEMIVSLTILSLLLGMASQAIVLATHSVASARRENERLTSMRALLADYPSRPVTTGTDNWRIFERDIAVGRTRLTALQVSSGDDQQSFLTFVPRSESRPP